MLRDVSIKLADLTLITGVNSSGKSSFIQALLLLKQNQDLIGKIEANNLLLESISKDNKTIDIIKEIVNKTENPSLFLK